MTVRYRVDLSEAERCELRALVSGGRQAVRKTKRAQILLAADAGGGDEEIAAGIAVGTATVYRTRRRFVEGNLDAALAEQPRPGASRKLTGKEGSPAGGDRLLGSAGGPRALDTGSAGRRSRAADRA
jgi:hypothetical protein